MSKQIQAMTIGEVAKQAGVGVQTIRFYERKGLLNKARRRQSGYRVFTAEVVGRIRFIKRTKRLGFSLREIRELLVLHLDGQATTADFKRHVDAKISEIDDRLNDLNSMRSGLQRLSNACSGERPMAECGLLDALEET